MRARLILVTAAPVCVFLAGAPSGGVGAAPVSSDRPVFTVNDSRITEASGIAPGKTTKDVLYVQNDSGDSARFFAIDRTSGRTRAEVDVPGAVNHDWEDIATAPDVRGVPSVWLADVGDNGEERDSVQIYRVDEPHLASTPNQTVEATGLQKWVFRYPDGPHNAEGFVIDTTQRSMYVITKSETNKTKVFRAPLAPSDTEQVFTQVGAIKFPTKAFLGGADLVTSAAYSPQLELLVVRTYLAGYFWRVPDGDIAAAVKAAPTGFALPPERQAEGIAFEGDTLWLNSEGVGQGVYRVPAPKPPSVAAPTPTKSAESYLPSPRSTAIRSDQRALAVAGVALLVAVAAGVGFRIRRQSR